MTGEQCPPLQWDSTKTAGVLPTRDSSQLSLGRMSNDSSFFLDTEDFDSACSAENHSFFEMHDWLTSHPSEDSACANLSPPPRRPNDHVDTVVPGLDLIPQFDNSQPWTDAFEMSSDGFSSAYNPQSFAGVRPQSAGSQTLYDNGRPSTLPFGMLNSLPLDDLAKSSRRTLPRRRSRYRFRQAEGTPIVLDAHISEQLNRGRSRGSLPTDPLQRWQSLPEAAEHVSQRSIGDANRSSHSWYFNDTSHGEEKTQQGSSSRAHSTHSNDSVASGFSALSADSSLSHQSTPPRTSRKARRKREAHGKQRPAPDEAAGKKRVFKCTFCCDDFKNKYDWSRHEKSLHMNLGGWLCAPFGPSPVSESASRAVCAFCNILEPTEEHLESHNYRVCMDSVAENRVFKRKDHLVQHLRLVHHLEVMPLIDTWKIQPPKIRSRCGFCSCTMDDWETRVDHLAVHFRAGLTMAHWQGEHDFEQAIAAQVTNAMPPYLIACESRSMVPFSATSSGTKDHQAQISDQILARINLDPPSGDILDTDTPLVRQAGVDPGSTTLKAFTELLTSHLSQFAQRSLRAGVFPTDDMFQSESRKVLYGCDDEWNQTIADDPQWLNAFRQGQDL